jgi:hypothetical protein
MLNQEKWEEVKNKKLHTGSGKNLDTACIMQMVSYVAGEKWTDHPECACPILTEYAIRLNDRFNDEHRQRLKDFIPLLVGTRAGDEIRIARKRLLYWRNVTATYPLILDLIKLPELAEKLRTFQNNVDDMKSAASFLNENKEVIKKATYAYANIYAYAYANTYAYAYADADAYAYTNIYAYAYANTYADADAYAYADALREKIADTAIETLKMLIAIQT